MNNFKFVGYVDVWSVLVQLYKHRTLFVGHTIALRTDGLDTSIYADWKSLKTLVGKARGFLSVAEDLEDVSIERQLPGVSSPWASHEAPDLLAFHVPLLTNPGAQLFCQNEAIHVPVGAVCWCREDLPHCAVNWGTTQRIHLVFSCRKKADVVLQ